MSKTSSRGAKDRKDTPEHAKDTLGLSKDTLEHTKDTPEPGLPQTTTDKHGGVVIAFICFGLLALLVAFNMSC